MVAAIGVDYDKYKQDETASFDGYSDMTSPRGLTTRRKQANTEMARISQEELTLRR